MNVRVMVSWNGTFTEEIVNGKLHFFGAVPTTLSPINVSITKDLFSNLLTKVSKAKLKKNQ